MTLNEIIECIKEVKEDYWEDDGYGHETSDCQRITTALDEAIERLEQTRWIPVSERLPELTINNSVDGKRYTEDVLVYDGADLRVGYFVRNDKLDFSYWVAYGEDVYEPIAWMPIEPYKASPTDEEVEE